MSPFSSLSNPFSVRRSTMPSPETPVSMPALPEAETNSDNARTELSEVPSNLMHATLYVELELDSYPEELPSTRTYPSFLPILVPLDNDPEILQLELVEDSLLSPLNPRNSIFGSSVSLSKTPKDQNLFTMVRPEGHLSSAEPPAKRRKLDEPNIILRDLSADEFLDQIKLFSSPLVTVEVGGQYFELPKNLLCYNSTYFQAAFNGAFAESIQQNITLEDFRADTFRLIIQWIFQGQFKIAPHTIPNDQVSGGPNKDAVAPKLDAQHVDTSSVQIQAQQTILAVPLSEAQIMAMSITTYLEFLELALYLDVLGPFDLIHNKIKEALTKDRNYLEPNHIRLSMKLPPGDSTRELVIRASVKSYIRKMVEPGFKDFKFQKEIDDLDDYAATLFREVGKAFDKKRCTLQSYSINTYNFIDPFTGQNFVIYPNFRS